MKMCQNQPKFKFYATLLDSYKYFLSSENEDAEQDFLNKINRVPYSSEAAEKGTAYNVLIDSILANNNPPSDEFALTVYNNYHFKTEHVNEIVERLNGSISQIFIKTVIDTKYGAVELYGYIDFIKMDIAIDLKTTKSYELGKYDGNMQRHVYPVALIDNGNEINTFEFIVTDFNSLYYESYPVNYENSLKVLRDTCESLIEYIEARRPMITDLKIFAKDPIKEYV